jgi:hypothetical protein
MGWHVTGYKFDTLPHVVYMVGRETVRVLCMAPWHTYPASLLQFRPGADSSCRFECLVL